MALSPNPPLLHLPAELLLLIVRCLCEPRNEIKSINDNILSLSRVCRRMRDFCFVPLFSRLKIKHTDRLRLLQKKCTEDLEFSRLIEELDLRNLHSPHEHLGMKLSQGSDEPYCYGHEILPELLLHLPSLVRLYLPEEQLNPKLLAAFNSHPKLATVGINDSSLDALRELASGTSLSMSKIQVEYATLDMLFGFHRPRFHSLMSQKPRVRHLIIRDKRNIMSGPGTVVIPGLENLDIGVYRMPTSLLSWLPAFVKRHPNLQLIRIFDHESILLDDWKSFWSLSILDASVRHTLTTAVKVVAFSISPTNVSASLDDWQVTQVELEIIESMGVSALAFVSMLAPRVSSLVIRMPARAMCPVHFDELVSSLCTFSSLKKLQLDKFYRHLVKDEIPCTLPSQANVGTFSGCVDAQAALLLLSADISERASSLALVHVTDEDYDYETAYGRYSWTLDVTYNVNTNREIEFVSTSRFHMSGIFRPPDELAQRLFMTAKNTRYHPPFNTQRP
ncbi:hypothetical protein R3P38DRAFT_2924564 [Favolaschia claudopus]|uniref:F-box domain-containing protein n=1 Tax=Favolaschia claudopus TaxID=2862362 RepID=A0AAW0C0F5_9AGAR